MGSTQSNDVSLCILTLNSASTLDYVLAWSRPYFDDCHILDGGSSDLTIEEAKAHNIIIHSNPECHHFGELRTELMSYAKHDWVYFCDSDELIDYGFLLGLPHFMACIPLGRIAYAFPRFSRHWDHRTAWPDLQTRMVNRKKVCYVGKLHEQAKPMSHERFVPPEWEAELRHPIIHLPLPGHVERAKHNRWYEMQGVTTRE